MSRSLYLAVAAFGLVALVLSGSAFAGEAEEAAWHARIENAVEKIESRVHALDDADADESAALDQRLTSLHERLTQLETDLELSAKRFWLYKGDNPVRQLSSYSQMAAALQSRASRASHASTQKLVGEANEKARVARQAREAEERRRQQQAAPQSEPASVGGSNRGTERRRSARTTAKPKVVEPRLVTGTSGERPTLSLVNVRLAKDLYAEFTVFFDKGTGAGTPPAAVGGGGKLPAGTVPAGTPDPVMELLLVAKREGIGYPAKGTVEFKTGEDEDERKVEGEYTETKSLTTLLGGDTTIQMLAGEIAGPDLRYVVDREDIEVTQVDGAVSSTETSIAGKALDLLTKLLSVYEQAEGDASGGVPTASGDGSTTTDGASSATSPRGSATGPGWPGTSDGGSTTPAPRECPKAGSVGG